MKKLLTASTVLLLGFLTLCALIAYDVKGPYRRTLVRDSKFVKYEFAPEMPESVACIHSINHPQFGPTIAVSVLKGIRLFDAKGARLGLHPPPPRCANGWFVQSDDDPNLEILCPGGGFSDAVLYDDGGQLIWRRSGTTPEYYGNASVRTTESGRPEFYVGYKRGVECIDARGKSLWNVSTGVWIMDTTVLPATNANDLTIIAVGDERLFFIDGSGSIKKQVTLPEKAYHVGSFMCDGSERPMIVVLSHRERRAVVTMWDANGQRVAERVFEGSANATRGLQVEAIPMGNGECAVALLTNYSSGSKSALLSVLSMNGDLIYQEIFGYTRGMLRSNVELPDYHGPALIVGDRTEGKLWAYAWRP